MHNRKKRATNISIRKQVRCKNQIPTYVDIETIELIAH